MSQVVYGLLSLGLLWVLACRIDKMMKGVTQQKVFLQHFLLGMSVFGAWLLGFSKYAEWSEAIIVLGVLQFFLFSLKRWKNKAPDDTVKEELTELPRESWPHVVGGRK